MHMHRSCELSNPLTASALIHALLLCHAVSLTEEFVVERHCSSSAGTAVLLQQRKCSAAHPPLSTSILTAQCRLTLLREQSSHNVAACRQHASRIDAYNPFHMEQTTCGTTLLPGARPSPHHSGCPRCAYTPSHCAVQHARAEHSHCGVVAGEQRALCNCLCRQAMRAVRPLWVRFETHCREASAVHGCRCR